MDVLSQLIEEILIGFHDVGMVKLLRNIVFLAMGQPFLLVWFSYDLDGQRCCLLHIIHLVASTNCCLRTLAQNFHRVIKLVKRFKAYLILLVFHFQESIRLVLYDL